MKVKTKAIKRNPGLFELIPSRETRIVFFNAPQNEIVIGGATTKTNQLDTKKFDRILDEIDKLRLELNQASK